MQNKFFRSRLNTLLLFILIVLLGVTIWIIKENKVLAPLYTPAQPVVQNVQTEVKDNILSDTHYEEYKNDKYGYSIKYPVSVNSGMEIINPASEQYFCDSEKDCGMPTFYTGFFLRDANGKEINRIDVTEGGNINKLENQEVTNTTKVKIGTNEFVVGDNTSWLGKGKAYFIQNGKNLFKITFLQDGNGKEYSSYVDLASLKFAQDLNPVPVQKPVQNNTVLQDIFHSYKNGMINECLDDGKTYYVASMNAYDGGGQTFDSKGKVVGQYEGFSGQYTGIVPKNCKNIYTVSPNIWGYKGINKYNLK